MRGEKELAKRQSFTEKWPGLYTALRKGIAVSRLFGKLGKVYADGR